MKSDASEAGRGYLRRGTPELRRANLALFVAGLATFAMLYSTQPLLPVFSAEFGVTPAVASLPLSLATGTLAIALILALSSFLMVLVALSPGFPALLALRAVQGVALAGLPAVAMAYLAEEVHPKHVGFTVGLYIAGNSVGKRRLKACGNVAWLGGFARDRKKS